MVGVLTVGKGLSDSLPHTHLSQDVPPCCRLDTVADVFAHTVQLQAHPINWLAESHCLLLVPVREASTNGQSSSSLPRPQPPPQPTFLSFPILRSTTIPGLNTLPLFNVLDCGSETASACFRQIKATASRFFEPSFALCLLASRVNRDNRDQLQTHGHCTARRLHTSPAEVA